MPQHQFSTQNVPILFFGGEPDTTKSTDQKFLKKISKKLVNGMI